MKSNSPEKRGFAVFFGPELDQHQLVAVIGEVLQRFFAARFVEKIRDHDDQARAADIRSGTA